MGKIRVVYIDDSSEHRSIYANQLTETGLLDVTPLQPPPKLDEVKALDLDPHLFLIDYDLSMVGESGEPPNYRGTEIASVLREKHLDLPFILLTRQDIIQAHKRTPSEFMSMFDSVYYKGNIDSDPHSAAEYLTSIARGFERLRNSDRTWKSLANLIGARDSIEREKLQELGPPLHTSDQGISTWLVRETAKWIRDILIKYPGILYDQVHAAVLLGISPTSFALESIQSLFMDAKYSGCFSPVEGRWWKNRLLDIAFYLALKHEVDLPEPERFKKAIELETGDQIDPSRCCTTNKEFADWVCYILNEPVMVDYSLEYHPDARPQMMDKARVSFKAIRESNFVDDDLFLESEREHLSIIRGVAGDE